MKWPEDMELVLLPGIEGTGNLFEPLIAELPRGARMRVVRYPARKDVSYEELLEIVMGEIDSSRPFVVLAESFSGPLAIELYERMGGNLKGMIFCSTFARSPRPFLLPLTRVLPCNWIWSSPVWCYAMRWNRLNNNMSASLNALFEKTHDEVPGEVILDRLKMLVDLDVVGLLEGIQVPCCYLQATWDRVVPPRCVKLFEAHICDIVVRRIDGSHIILQTSPKACAEAICEFLDGLAESKVRNSQEVGAVGLEG